MRFPEGTFLFCFSNYLSVSASLQSQLPSHINLVTACTLLHVPQNERGINRKIRVKVYFSEVSSMMLTKHTANH